MNQDPSSRYSRQTLFPAIGEEGQERLRQAHVLVVGCGALGSVQANLLARAGVGSLTLLDRDILDWSNLQRQLLYDETQVQKGMPKAIAAAQRLQEINSDIQLHPVICDVTHTNVEPYIQQADLVLDATDNFAVRFLLNDACLKHKTPWIYGACVGSYGITMNILPEQTPCLRCLFETMPAPGTTPTCDTSGVIGSIVTLVASLQVTEALKWLVGDLDAMRVGVWTLDLWKNESMPLRLNEPRPDCPACQHHRYDYLSGQESTHTTVLCGRNTVQVTPSQTQPLSLNQVAEQLKQAGPIQQNEYLVRCELDSQTLTVFVDGRILVQGCSEPTEARTLVSRWLGV